MPILRFIAYMTLVTVLAAITGGLVSILSPVLGLATFSLIEAIGALYALALSNA